LDSATVVSLWLDVFYPGQETPEGQFIQKMFHQRDSANSYLLHRMYLWIQSGICVHETFCMILRYEIKAR
jgi:hypothetical protein